MRAFSLLEVIFVIIIFSILYTIISPSAISLLKDSLILKAKSQLATIRMGLDSAISKNILSHNYICPNLEGDDEESFFEGVLVKPIKNSSNIKWMLQKSSDSEDIYILKLGDEKVEIYYIKDFNRRCPLRCRGPVCKELEI